MHNIYANLTGDDSQHVRETAMLLL